jgi:starch synthase
MGLEDDLRARGAAVVGILNGVDYDDWDPREDRYLSHRYGADTVTVKTGLKYEFLSRLGLRHGTRTALLGIVSRFTVQKGFDLLFESLPAVLAERDVCLVALGNGEARYEEFFAGLQQRFPRKVMYHCGYSDELAHWIEAASDIFLMPSLYEPCGLNQMYSLRYGTIPIVRRTGGLADSVELFDAQTKLGTGVVFNDFNSEAMAWALGYALDLHAQPALWSRLVRNAMLQDFSWQRQGALYTDLYARLISAA